MKISKRAGFACVTGACVALTGTAFAGGGDDPFSSTTITSLPFADTGDTTALTNQFDAVCPFSGSTSPDAWYNYTPGADSSLDLELCESGYDTKIYVLDGAFNVIGCNDDACTSSGGGAFRSELLGVPVMSGTLYYIVVDGWSGDFGAYDLNVTGGGVIEECIIECTGTDEGEPCVDDGSAVDTINPGCNVTTGAPIFIDVACGETVCGIAWGNAGTRDTDWYRLPSQGSATEITWTALGEFNSAAFYLGLNPDCAALAVVGDASSASCEAGTIVAVADATDETWWFMGYNDFDGLPCGGAFPQGNDYSLNWDCGGAVFPCPELGDTDNDGDVDFQDLLTVLANFGPCP